MSLFSRTSLLLGEEGLQRLAGARVTVAGLGAVGSYAVEALARVGVGSLRLVDFDVVQPSNRNRQLYALESTTGLPKIEVAERRVRDINPACHVEALDLFVGEESCERLLQSPPDVLVDAIDSLNPKITLLVAARAAGVAVVSSMGAARRLDPLSVRVGDISETHACPLARVIRKRLRRRGVEHGLRCVYSVEAPAGVLQSPDESWDRSMGRPRLTLGSLSTIPGIFGLTAAAEVIEILLA